MTHFSITQASIMALVSQLASFVAGFGIINSTQVGLVITIATAAVNAAFLIANSLHHMAHANSTRQ